MCATSATPGTYRILLKTSYLQLLAIIEQRATQSWATCLEDKLGGLFAGHKTCVVPFKFVTGIQVRVQS